MRDKKQNKSSLCRSAAFTADIRTQLDEAHEELEHTKQELSEYRGSICGASMERQDYSVLLSEDVTGYVVSYKSSDSVMRNVPEKYK
jgi:hypothetical protein